MGTRIFFNGRCRRNSPGGVVRDIDERRRGNDGRLNHWRRNGLLSNRVPSFL